MSDEASAICALERGIRRQRLMRMTALRQKRSVVEIGSRRKRDMLPMPPGDQPPLAGSPSRPDPRNCTHGQNGKREYASSNRTPALATQCGSHQSPGKFPANREFYREKLQFWG